MQLHTLGSRAKTSTTSGNGRRGRCKRDDRRKMPSTFHSIIYLHLSLFADCGFDGIRSKWASTCSPFSCSMTRLPFFPCLRPHSRYSCVAGRGPRGGSWPTSPASRRTHMHAAPAWNLDQTRHLTRRELATVLAVNATKAQSSENSWRNLNIVRLHLASSARRSRLGNIRIRIRPRPRRPTAVTIAVIPHQTNRTPCRLSSR